MSKRKSMSLDEKRAALLNIYHTTKTVYNLQTIEKAGTRAGVVTQTIKDVNQSLIDDSMVDQDKIGSGSFFWAFPSKARRTIEGKMKEIETKHVQYDIQIEKFRQQIHDAEKDRNPTEEREKKLMNFSNEKVQRMEYDKELLILKENDPAELDRIEKEGKMCHDSVNRWTDNTFTIESYLITKRNCDKKQVHGLLNMKDDFDYVEN